MGALIPIICWLLALMIFVGLWFLVLKRSRSTIPSCPACGHDVRGGTRPRCVECGRSLARGVVPIGGVTRRRRWALVGVILVLAGALVLPAFAWGGEAMYAIARWRVENQSEVEISYELILESVEGDRFIARFKGVDSLQQPDIVRITFRIEEPGQKPIIWEQAGPGTWNVPLGVTLDGVPIVADLTARLDGEPRGLVTRAMLEDPEAFATFLTMVASNAKAVRTRVMIPGRDEPLMRFNGSSYSEPGSRSVNLMPTNIYLLPQRIALGLAALALLLILWVLLRPGLVDWTEYNEPPST